MAPWYTVHLDREWVVMLDTLPVATPMRTASPRKAIELGDTCTPFGEGSKMESPKTVQGCHVLATKLGKICTLCTDLTEQYTAILLCDACLHACMVNKCKWLCNALQDC